VHAPGLALGVFSALHMSMAAMLSQEASQERPAYLLLLAFALTAFAMVTCYRWLGTLHTQHQPGTTGSVARVMGNTPG